ncbi:ATP-binding protein [Alienimonas californiensis]|uniref:AAA-like domain protein n=1 Tax=Alienimonas californiensis TaxID=2527989 RepID=A0A517P4Y7_9PLAN|nr:DUF87 domain-containing protein [Alienimonas californiensis]QDT14447.1 AAA-like domain protein [Alienimonas californiensis]
MPSLPAYETLGQFYLGREHDPATGKTGDDYYLYDSRDLTTHAVVVGMTGSGKTGLCLSLLEEAAIDGVPAICIDPKGDLGNLALAFPDLKPSDFRPWVDASAAIAAGETPDEYAASTAKRWKQGLAEWDQDPERVGLYKRSAEVTIYTPGSDAGVPITVLKSFAAPPEAVRRDAEAFREKVSASAAGLLSLIGLDPDPVASRDHILLANVLDHAWRGGEDLSLADLIRRIADPPFDRVGVFDLESFYPRKDRTGLAMRVNNLLASPTFAGWLKGEPLKIDSLLYTADGRPRISILSIAHLSEAERMFFVTLLLGEFLTWTRQQKGTGSLRALLYMDEVFGYLPPIGEPPTKRLFLTLLKQARAYGVGLVLATQNPVDVDYKALSNAGTWFLGRLQTERDKMRVLEGLEGASLQAGARFDHARMDEALAGLKSRQFVVNNVHDDGPAFLTTRWVLSYLAGPLTRGQIGELMKEQKRHAEAPRGLGVKEEQGAPASPPTARPVLPAGVKELALAADRVPTGSRTVLRPALYGTAKLHYVSSTYHLDEWREVSVCTPVRGSIPADPWGDGLETVPAGAPAPLDRAYDLSRVEFAPAPAHLAGAKNYGSWQGKLKDHLYRERRLTVYQCRELGEVSEPGEDERDFRVRLTQAAREHRDREVEKLRTRYGSKIRTAERMVGTARRRVAREQEQADRAKQDSYLSLGGSLLGALFGRKLLSSTNVRRASTGMRSLGRASDQADDVGEAEEMKLEREENLAAIEEELAAEIAAVEDELNPSNLKLTSKTIAPRKSDIDVAPLSVLWRPWSVDRSGIAEPGWG